MGGAASPDVGHRPATAEEIADGWLLQYDADGNGELSREEFGRFMTCLRNKSRAATRQATAPAAAPRPSHNTATNERTWTQPAELQARHGEMANPLHAPSQPAAVEFEL